MTRLPVAHGLCLLCGKPFSMPGQALHKRFCCEEHRNKWHSLRRAELKKQVTNSPTKATAKDNEQ